MCQCLNILHNQKNIGEVEELWHSRPFRGKWRNIQGKNSVYFEVNGRKSMWWSFDNNVNQDRFYYLKKGRSSSKPQDFRNNSILFSWKEKKSVCNLFDQNNNEDQILLFNHCYGKVRINDIDFLLSGEMGLNGSNPF